MARKRKQSAAPAARASRHGFMHVPCQAGKSSTVAATPPVPDARPDPAVL